MCYMVNTTPVCGSKDSYVSPWMLTVNLKSHSLRAIHRALSSSHPLSPRRESFESGFGSSTPMVSGPAHNIRYAMPFETRESFESGFGSSTPMVSGPAHNIRYAMHAPRAVEMVKTIIGEQGKVYRGGYEEIVLSKHALQQVAAASDHTHLWQAVQQPFFVFTPCRSTAFPNKTLNGTRLALLTRPYGVEFLIETVLTPHRWNEFDAEMAASWKAICLAVANTSLRDSDLPAYRKAVQDSILRMAYYWYNFMPLARGTAMTGHVVTLGLLLAIDLHASQPIPPSVQVDWESILCPSAALFLRSVSSWLYPSLTHSPRLKELLSVEDAFPSLGDVVEVLSAAVGEMGQEGGEERAEKWGAERGEDGGEDGGERGGGEGGEEERRGSTGGNQRPGGALEGTTLATGDGFGEGSSSGSKKMDGVREKKLEGNVSGGVKIEGGEKGESGEREEIE
ncbi:unnamed protein product, partial [Closterium sp. Yama58-4]